MNLLGGLHPQNKKTGRDRQRDPKAKKQRKKFQERERGREKSSEAGPRAWGVPCSWGAGLNIPEVREQSPDRM